MHDYCYCDSAYPVEIGEKLAMLHPYTWEICAPPSWIVDVQSFILLLLLFLYIQAKKNKQI